MTHSLKQWSVLLALGMTQCGGSTAQDGTRADGGAADSSTANPNDADATDKDGDGNRCCPISPAPACCLQYGGSPDQFVCGYVCDFIPEPDFPGWEQRIDKNGCPYWWTPPDAPRGCGHRDARGPIDARDARTDMSTDGDVVSDAAADRDAFGVDGSNSEPDVGPHADGSSDIDAGLCCPISDAPACCMQYGGSPGTFGCRSACDGMPWPNYPGWERRTDENGCPYWWTPPDAPFGCNGLPPEAGGGG